MMTLIYIVAAIIVLIILLAAIAPKSYNVSRSIVIDKPKEIVFPYLKMVKNQDHWSPWKKKDLRSPLKDITPSLTKRKKKSQHKKKGETLRRRACLSICKSLILDVSKKKKKERHINPLNN